jgi:thiamine-monophosphate kinase
VVQWWREHGDGAIAAMDSSDGLADAVIQLCRASQVGAIVDAAPIPLPAGLAASVGREQALEWALYGGEDFELVLCLSPNLAQDLVKYLGHSAAIVGEIIADPTVHLKVGETARSLSQIHGFQHFSSAEL